SRGCRRYGHLDRPIRASAILRSKFVAIRHCPADSKHHWKKRPPSFGLELLSGLGPIAKPVRIRASQSNVDGGLGLLDSPHLAKFISKVVQVIAIVFGVTRCKRAHYRKHSLKIR